MSGPHQQPFCNRQSASENGASDNPAPRVDFLPDGKVRMTYASYTDYARDQKIGIDRLSNMPPEMLLEICKCVIPNRGRIAIGFDHCGPNTSGIRPGTLNILRVSKHLSEIALKVLYGCRWFRISASNDYRKGDFGDDFVHTGTKNLETRWSVLRASVDPAHPVHLPLDCFRLLVFRTPAHQYLAKLEVMINKSMGEVLIDGKLLKALQHAKGLRELELFMGDGTPDIMPFVNELEHVREIKVFSWLGKDVLYETQVAKRNQRVQRRQATQSV